MEHAGPEVLADDGRRQERGARLRRERIDPRGDRRSHGRRQLVGGTSIQQRGGELLDEQRVPLRDLDQSLDRRQISSPGQEVATRSSAESTGDSASSGIVVAPRTPLPQPGRTSSSSERASARKVAGASRTWEARYSRRSSCAGSAQWMSSKTNTVGCSRATCSTNRRAAKNSWTRLLGGLVADPSPINAPRSRAVSSASSDPMSSRTRASSFVHASDDGSDSKIPATWRTCSANARYPSGRTGGSDRGRTAHPSLRSSTRSRRAIRDLPIPVGPTIVTRWGRSSAAARSQMESSMAQLSRPPDERSGRGRPLGRRSDRLQREPGLDGVALPLRVDRLELLVTDHVPRGPIGLLTDHETARPALTVWSREAVFTTSPNASASPDSGRDPIDDDRLARVHRRPDLERARPGRPRFRSSIACTTRSPARTARSASSPWATGAPKTAITASPMNFSTVPPNRSISCFARAWKPCKVSRTSSGSALSDRDVKPTRSTNSTETSLRSSRARSGASSSAPHVGQNAASGGVSRPQFGHAGMRES